MQVVFLGTGGYQPNERRHTASIMLPDVGVVLDAGTGFFRMPQHLRTRELQVFLSHAHLDHVCGLTFPMVPLLSDAVDSISVYGTARTLNGVQKHLFSEELFPVALPQTQFLELDGSVAVGGDGTLSHCRLEHPGGSTGYRIDWPGCSLAYITDTVAPGGYSEFVAGVDLLIHECYFPDEMAEWAIKTGHSHTTPVAELARDAGVGRLALVHIDPHREDDDPIGLELANSIFAKTFIAEDQMVVELPE